MDLAESVILSTYLKTTYDKKFSIVHGVRPIYRDLIQIKMLKTRFKRSLIIDHVKLGVQHLKFSTKSGVVISEKFAKVN